MTRVACGSAHSLAWSTDKPFASTVPTRVPLEYDVLKELPPALIRNRLVLLLHFSDLLCPAVSMFPLSGDVSLDSLRTFLVYMVKEITFRKVAFIRECLFIQTLCDQTQSAKKLYSKHLRKYLLDIFIRHYLLFCYQLFFIKKIILMQ